MQKISKKTIIPLAISLIVVLMVILAVVGKLTGKNKNVATVSQPAVQQIGQPRENSASAQPPVITETTTDAMTGTVMAVSAGSITVKNETGEKTFVLAGKINTFSIDKVKGIVIRNFSEVKKGIKVTVSFNVKANSGAYIVLE